MTTNDAIDEHLRPPLAERRPHVLAAHGDERIDDWYWLREKDDPAVKALIEAENAYTKARTADLEPLVDSVYQEILSRTKLSDVSYPSPYGEFSYYQKTLEDSQHAITCRRPRSAPLPPALTGEEGAEDHYEELVLDENALAEGKDYLSVGDSALSPDQRLYAYAYDTTGNETMTIRIRQIESGSDLADEIEGAYYGLEFAADSRTLFYTRPDDSHRPWQVWRHLLGTDPSEDVKIFEEPDERFFVGVDKSKDGKLVMIVAESSTTSEWRYVPASSPTSEPLLVAPRRPGVLYTIEHHSGSLVVLSNDKAENFALYLTELSKPGHESWQLLLAEREDVRLEEIDVVSGYVLVGERGHATTSVRVVPLSGGTERLIEAPPAGVASLAGNLEFETAKVRYQTSSLIEPPVLRELDLQSGSDTVLRRQQIPGGYDPSDYATEQRWARSEDGTMVPVTVAWHKERGAEPGSTLLYGYGSYGLSSDPLFPTRRPIHPLLDRGVLFAMAHVRGGEELGRHWYLDGKLEHKHHSFEDFVAAAKMLVSDGLAANDRLAAHGASAGGLLMGASVNLVPQAFCAVLAEVPFVDCLTTMLDPTIPLTTNEWEEWGDPLSSKEAYEWMKAYSPYDNVRPERYPKMLVTGGLTDPRVGYFEPTKWVQKLRAANPENAERVLLLMDVAAGHSGPSGRFDAWRKRAFALAFLLEALGAEKRLRPMRAG